MNIDKTMTILKILFENEGDIPTKFSHISAAYSPYVSNKVPTYCYDIALYLNGNICQLSHLHIHENQYKH